MSLKKHFYYWILPFIIMGILLSFYFSKIPALVEIVSPKINWELGALENLQLVIIFGIISLAAFAIFRMNNPILKVGTSFICIFSIFVFLEEIDYGTHFIQDNILENYTGVYNIHNQGNNAKLFKRSVYIGMILLFIIGPFLKPLIQNKFIKFLLPLPRIITAVSVAVLTSFFARSTIAFNIRTDGGLGVNIGEFSEVVIYYIFFLYLFQLLFEKKEPAVTKS